MELEIRNQKIIDLHNQGKSAREIASELNIGKTTVNNAINSMIKKGEAPPKEVVDVKLTGKEDRFTSFVGFERVNVNEYAHKESGEVVRVAYVKAKNPGEFGYFVKLND